MLKIIIPIIVLAGAGFFAKHLMDTGPDAKKRPFVQRMPVVEVQSLKLGEYKVNVEASGIVTAGTQTNLVAEVSGRILNISDNFLEGSYFDENKVLLEIDKANYLNAVEIAKSEVAANEANLKQIQAEEKSNKRSIQLAKQNLALGRKEVARLRSLLRKKVISRSVVDVEAQKVNQLQQRLQDLQGVQSSYASRATATQARINSTLARLKQETLNLSRTVIKAPYEGRVLKKNVDFGQYVSVGTVLGEVYATDHVNIELLLSLNQFELLGMPEAFRNQAIKASEMPEVILSNPNSLRKDTWKGRVVRTSAALDADSRQIRVIVRVDNPYDAKEGVSTPIRIGQYLKASIEGKTFENVFVLPSVAVLYNREIKILKNNKLSIVPVNVIWNSASETIIEADPNLVGEQLITTHLTQAVDGMQAITIEEQRKRSKMKKNKQQEKLAEKNKVESALRNKNDQERRKGIENN